MSCLCLSLFQQLSLSLSLFLSCLCAAAESVFVAAVTPCDRREALPSALICINQRESRTRLTLSSPISAKWSRTQRWLEILLRIMKGRVGMFKILSPVCTPGFRFHENGSELKAVYRIRVLVFIFFKCESKWRQWNTRRGESWNTIDNCICHLQRQSDKNKFIIYIKPCKETIFDLLYGGPLLQGSYINMQTGLCWDFFPPKWS